ncbi:hypothetical protein Sjap_026444 [Stephania japonica]|uniref:Uncharacterized protein n=1 Tax=Stephania japonica TaxID=461633 RepID=A0AAP0EBF8_9MAGN
MLDEDQNLKVLLLPCSICRHCCGGCDDNHYIHGFPDYAHHMESKHIVIFGLIQ